MLLSFAQFEREVTSERIRDKIAASKKKGIWVGGTVPMGYRVKERKLVVDEEEANTVRHIFARYLELGSIRALVDDLRERGVVTRVRKFATGKTVGGIPFMSGPLAHLLKNRMYLGEINHGENSYPGDHPAIVPKDLFDAVQASLAEKAAAVGFRRARSNALLTGRLYDHLGRPMTPTYAVKGGVRYRYYVSIHSGKRGVGDLEAIVRVPTAEVEQAITDALSELRPAVPELGRRERDGVVSDRREDDAQLILGLVERATIGPNGIEIALSAEGISRAGSARIGAPWTKTPTRVERQILPPTQGERSDPRAMSSDTRSRLLSSIARARVWLDELISGRIPDLDALAIRESRTSRSMVNLLALAFTAPDLVKAVVQNRLPRGIGLTEMADLPCEWGAQQGALGIADTTQSRTVQPPRTGAGEALPGSG
jgi:site-specific DNA recombinase